MTDHLTPENQALVERVLGYGTARTYNRHEIDRIIDAARAEGRRAPGEALVATIETALRNSLHWQNPDAVDKADHAIHLSGGVTPASSGCTLDLRDIAQSIADAIPTRDEAALQEAGPVGWRIRYRSQWAVGGWKLHDSRERPDVSDLFDGTRGHEIQPRYTAPPPPPVGGQAGDVELHPATAKLVSDFSAALAEKLAKAERKYGYTDGWLDANWEADCREALLKHIEKGDPRDVAAYCAFMWFHRWSTSAASPAPTDREGGR